MKALNLFGEMQEVEVTPKVHQSPYQLIKAQNKYRLAENKEQSCRRCIHRVPIEFHNKNYHKCEMIGDSRSEATDIRLKNTCNKFMKK